MYDYENFRYITQNKNIIMLSKNENKVLKLLMDANGKIITNEKISYALYNIPLDSNIHSCIRSLMRILRKKLGITIKNKRGVGYYIVK